MSGTGTDNDTVRLSSLQGRCFFQAYELNEAQTDLCLLCVQSRRAFMASRCLTRTYDHTYTFTDASYCTRTPVNTSTCLLCVASERAILALRCLTRTEDVLRTYFSGMSSPSQTQTLSLSLLLFP